MPRQVLDRFTPDAAFLGIGDRARPSRASLDETLGALTDMRLLELLTTRLCHELSGPIAAINNGIELLAEERPDPASPLEPSFALDAVMLVADSARRARDRLQFYRFSYGASRLGTTAGPAPHELAAGFLAKSRIVCDYAESVRMMSPEWQKLACNLVPVGADALPRGGRLALTDNPLTIEAVGEVAALSSEAHTALTLTTPISELSVRTVQAYFAGLLARALGRRLIASAEPGRVRLAAIAANS